MAGARIFPKRFLRVPGRLGRERHGATAVEFGLLAPAFLLVVFGLIEFGMFIWNKHSLEFAVEETGRSVMTMTSVTEGTIVADLKGRLHGVDTAAVTASVTQEIVGPTTFVTIQASYTYTFFMASLLGVDSITMQSKARVPLNPPE